MYNLGVVGGVTCSNAGSGLVCQQIQHLTSTVTITTIDSAMDIAVNKQTYFSKLPNLLDQVPDIYMIRYDKI